MVWEPFSEGGGPRPPSPPPHLVAIGQKSEGGGNPHHPCSLDAGHGWGRPRPQDKPRLGGGAEPIDDPLQVADRHTALRLRVAEGERRRLRGGGAGRPRKMGGGYQKFIPKQTERWKHLVVYFCIQNLVARVSHSGKLAKPVVGGNRLEIVEESVKTLLFGNHLPSLFHRRSIRGESEEEHSKAGGGEGAENLHMQGWGWGTFVLPQ